MGTQIFITNIFRIVVLLTFSLREKENFSPIIFFIHKISTKVIIVLVCVTYNNSVHEGHFPHCQHQAFPAVVAFKQGLPIFHFSF
jgi:hypothetical protein